MSIDVATALIGGVAGLGTGVVGSFVAPWAQWGTEKRRLQRAARVTRVAEWRQGIESITEASKAMEQQQRLLGHPEWEDEARYEDACAKFADTMRIPHQHWFHTLEPHLSRDERVGVDAREDIVSAEFPALTDEHMCDYLVPLLSRAVTRIEEHWNLT